MVQRRFAAAEHGVHARDLPLAPGRVLRACTGGSAPVVRRCVRRVQHLVVVGARAVLPSRAASTCSCRGRRRVAGGRRRSLPQPSAPPQSRVKAATRRPSARASASVMLRTVREHDDDARRPPVDDRGARAQVGDPALLVGDRRGEERLEQPSARRVDEQRDPAARLRSRQAGPSRDERLPAAAAWNAYSILPRSCAVVTREWPCAGGLGASAAAEVPARYGPGYVLARAPRRLSDAATTASPPSLRVRRFAARFDDQPVSWRRSYQSGEPGALPRRSASASTPSLTVDAAGKLASEFQPAHAPVPRSCTQNAAQPR